ncbi:MAG: hypothetical protein V1797_08670 [Pseudomonadota bacterium]
MAANNSSQKGVTSAGDRAFLVVGLIYLVLLMAYFLVRPMVVSWWAADDQVSQIPGITTWLASLHHAGLTGDGGPGWVAGVWRG